MSSSKRVFLSHSSRDKEDVRRLAEDLRAEGINVWLDEWEIAVGDRISQKIQQGLAESDYLAVWLTKDAIESGWVEREWQAKFHEEVNQDRTVVLPLLGEHCTLPPLLRDKRYADFRDDYAKGLAELLKVFDRTPARQRQAARRKDILFMVSAINDDAEGNIRRHFQGEGFLTLSYKVRQDNDITIISPSLPYLDVLNRGGPITGIRSWNSTFEWQFPKLDLKLVNNSKETLFFTHAVFQIEESLLDPQPIVVIRESAYNLFHLLVLNEGWGNATECVVRFNIARRDAVADFGEDLVHEVRIGTLTDSHNADISPALASLGMPAGYLSSASDRWDMDDETQEVIKRFGHSVVVYGQIDYIGTDVAGKSSAHSVKFSTNVSLVMPGPGAPGPPTYAYEAMLDIERSHYEVAVPISHIIKPGDADRFTITVGAPKSSRHRFDLQLKFNESGEILSPPIVLDICLPRRDVKNVRSKSAIEGMYRGFPDALR